MRGIWFGNHEKVNKTLLHFPLENHEGEVGTENFIKSMILESHNFNLEI